MPETLDRDPRRLSSARRLALAVLAAVAAAVAAVLMSAAAAQAGRAAPGAFPVEQPDGDRIVVRQWGDEWYNGLESASGHTLLRGADGFWVYARQRPDGTLAPSSLVAGRDDPTGSRHLRDEVVAGQALEQRSVGRTGPDRATRVDEGVASLRSRASLPSSGRSAPAVALSPAPAMGTAPSLVILAQFTDRPSLGTTPAQWSSRFFGAGKSVRDYFEKASYGDVHPHPRRRDQRHPRRRRGRVGEPGHAQPRGGSATSTATTWRPARAIIAADPFVDYAAYDTNGNGVVRNDELHITVVAAGFEASYGSTDPEHNVWAHTQLPPRRGHPAGRRHLGRRVGLHPVRRDARTARPTRRTRPTRPRSASSCTS